DRWPEEAPRVVRPVIAGFGTDVAAPDDLNPALAQGGNEAHGLRVVHQDDVAALDQAHERFSVGFGDPPHDVSFGITESAVVTGFAVQPVVYALGDGEELGVAVDHDPPAVHARALRIPHETMEHLGHAPA